MFWRLFFWYPWVKGAKITLTQTPDSFSNHSLILANKTPLKRNICFLASYEQEDFLLIMNYWDNSQNKKLSWLSEEGISFAFRVFMQLCLYRAVQPQLRNATSRYQKALTPPVLCSGDLFAKLRKIIKPLGFLRGTHRQFSKLFWHSTKALDVTLTNH